MSEFDGYVDDRGDQSGKPVGDRENKKSTPTSTEKLFIGTSNGELPADIAEVWGGDPNAVLFIREWGLEAFRTSKLHQMAVLEHERSAKLAPVRQTYVKRQAKK